MGCFSLALGRHSIPVATEERSSRSWEKHKHTHTHFVPEVCVILSSSFYRMEGVAGCVETMFYYKAALLCLLALSGSAGSSSMHGLVLILLQVGRPRKIVKRIYAHRETIDRGKERK